jgi:acetyl/propionyl-CoA carboxylase alpha subunit
MPARLPSRVLVANRGEIAVRVARTCRAMKVGVVTIHAPGDRESPHRLEGLADLEVPSYLDVGAILDAAKRSGADAIHPGYGFLSENAAFADAVRGAGLTWIGPPPEAIEAMGSKTGARAAMQAAGVPVVPGTEAASPERLVGQAAGLGYPVIVKPAGGGGGKGMVRVDRPADLAAAARAAAEQAQASFGDGSVYVEKLIERPRHVEIQVFADDHGHVVSLGERECSIQRRHQKIVEESPSVAVDAALRQRMGDAAVAAARAVGYRSAGTVEFLLAPDGAFYFLEVNTRLQVEHPVTELVTGLDLVALQLLVAAGRPLPPTALHPVSRGHAIEARVYAEDPAVGHLPQAGRLLVVREPQGPGLRVDAALVEGGEVSVDYDPMLAKVSAWGADREEARLRLAEGLSRFVVLGVRTNLGYLQDILAHPAFAAGDLSTAFLDEHFAGWTDAPPDDLVLAASALPASAARAAGGARASAAPDPWSTLTGFRLGASA